MWRRIKHILTQVVMLSTGAFASCNDGQGLFPDEGTISLAITDAPVDSATSVVIEIDAIELARESGDPITFDFDPDRAIDLLDLDSGDTASLLQNEEIRAGRYTSIRLLVNAHANVQGESFIDVSGGGRFPLVIPDDALSGLTLNRAFTVEENDTFSFVVDFDLRKSIIGQSGQDPNYIFKPVLRIVDNGETGSLTGVVASNLVPDQCTPFVYVFGGEDITPDDLDLASDVDPLVSVPARFNSSANGFRYDAAFLEPGSFTVSFTCNGRTDTPEGDEPLQFQGTVNATIREDQTTTVNFN
jgi:Domain of unknown function (DUF4382)